MSEKLRLMCVLAHPDDESLGVGGTLAKYASEGVETYLVTATRGERGRFGQSQESPGPEVLGQVRESELRAAARELGVREVSLLGFMDGELDQVRPAEAVAKIVHCFRRVKPHVVVTFGPEGAYGHPDHIAISQLATAAVVCSADPDFGMAGDGGAVSDPHRVSKLYYIAWSEKKWTAYQAVFRQLRSNVDGIERQATPWPDWAVTTRIDTRNSWHRVWQAVSCHKTQMAIYRQLESLSEEHHLALWGSQEYYRALSTVNGGRQRENDLFEGLRNGGSGN